MSAARQERIRELAGAAGQATPSVTIHPDNLASDFGSLSFGERNLRQHLPKNAFKALKKALDAGTEIDAATADIVASAMKHWALAHGATHFTHWFQPITVIHQAEKHDSFMSIFPGQDQPIFEFSGSDLIRGEPDASSFPSGDLRKTHEARGYTFWDPTSPAFIRVAPEGGNATLCIPTAFCSWTGDALDQKTPLLRSTEVLSEECVKLLRLSGDAETKGVFTTLGVEQEFFLIDRAWALQRPDLLLTGRSVLGAAPFKGQELDDHYFAQMPARVMACIQEVEAELWKLGMPTRTRHNEVAPSQYEMAPIFEKASVASDHNLLTMDVLDRVARRHDLHVLLHEKPFAGINGSGKHNNWSISTINGDNLLEPGATPAENARFLLFLTAVIKAVDDHQDTMRFAVANTGQEYRLGANEAPPAIMSVYLGEELDQVVQELIAPEREKETRRNSTMMLGVSAMPPLKRDRTDRNRTSPFAFTGNKFEFRAVGSTQHCAVPNTVMNVVVADAIRQIREDIEIQMKENSFNFTVARQLVVQRTLAKHYRIVQNGNGYSAEWPAEAAKRGLLNLVSTPDALKVITSEKNIRLFSSMRVLSEPELRSRQNILFEQYAMSVRIEARCLLELSQTHVLPAVLKHQAQLANSIVAVKAAGAKASERQVAQLDAVTTLIEKLYAAQEVLNAAGEGQEKAENEGFEAWAFYNNTIVLPAMGGVREVADAAERIIDDSFWSLPKYREILFLK